MQRVHKRCAEILTLFKNFEVDKKTGFVDDTFLCIPRPNRLAVLIGNFQLLSKLSKQGCEATPLLQAPAPRLPMLAEEAPAIATSKKNVNNF